MLFLALGMVFQGEAKVPVLASLPVVATKKILPARTVNGRPLLVPTPGTFTTILPVAAAAPSWKIILASDQSGYEAAAPPPMVTVEVPCVAPNPLPQIVTQTPLLLWPPVFGPLSR